MITVVREYDMNNTNNSTLNVKHKVTLTEGQMSTILYIMEGYINPSDDYSYDPDFREDVDNLSLIHI